MASSSYCSLNFPAPPTASPSSPISATPRVSCSSTAPRERSWRNRCVLGLTCAIIGLDGGDFAVVAGDQDRAMAMDMQSSTLAVAAPTRWSEKRACLPWRINSLETIVPENLPRPSARRRWEATGFSETAPPVRVAVKSGAKGCFSM
ncbi:protein CHLOROPLAST VESICULATION [Salvia miltiorrhiza]|uniref:protein CHLOROPLAST VESICULATION n=1 Tax=Salvia miltiorrhiza TaxID=226208 RepID=UPI0025AD7978|nr:protein CHLOROPLAST VESICULATION [Salvia miltiorrhiza]